MKDYSHLFDDVTKDSDEFAALSMSIIDRIRDLQQDRGWTQKHLAEVLGKKDSEVSKWMGGLHNITLRNIARLNVAFGEPVMCVPGMTLPSVQTRWEGMSANIPFLSASNICSEANSIKGDYTFFISHPTPSYGVSGQVPIDPMWSRAEWNEFNETPSPQDSDMKVVHLRAA